MLQVTMNLIQIELTGSRVVGPLSGLGYLGPKHHGLVIGQSMHDNQIYVIEYRMNGYELNTLQDFQERYGAFGPTKILPNEGEFSNLEVANRALEEITINSKRQYNLATNNCESFCNRAMFGNSVSSQVVSTIIGASLLVGLVLAIKKGGFQAA